MEKDCLFLAAAATKKLMPMGSKDAQFVPTSRCLSGIAIRGRCRSESRAIRSDEAGRIVKAAFGSYFADGFSGCLHEHPRVLQTIFHNPVSRSLAGFALESAFERREASIRKPGVVLKAERGQHILGNDILGIGARFVEYFAEKRLQLGGDWRVQQQEKQLLQFHREELFQKAPLVAEAAQDRIPKAFESGRHLEDEHFVVLGSRRVGIRVRNVEAEPEILQGRFVEENRNALVSRILGHAFAKQVASPFEKDRFARLHYDFLLGESKHLRSLGNENKRVLSHEYVARLLFDALVIFAEAELAGLKKAAVGRFGKVSWNAE